MKTDIMNKDMILRVIIGLGLISTIKHMPNKRKKQGNSGAILHRAYELNKIHMTGKEKGHYEKPKFITIVVHINLMAFYIYHHLADLTF